jgi:hypothetical protein
VSESLLERLTALKASLKKQGVTEGIREVIGDMAGEKAVTQVRSALSDLSLEQLIKAHDFCAELEAAELAAARDAALTKVKDAEQRTKPKAKKH